jgi:CheY-like chemotaxis protein
VQRILIVEDRPENRALYREVLERWGYEVSEAVNGAEALERLAEVDPDLVIMDLQMPVLDGLSALRRIREGPGRQVPVIALTASMQDCDEGVMLEQGFDGFLAKPVELSVLRRRVEAFCPAAPGAAVFSRGGEGSPE